VTKILANELPHVSVSGLYDKFNSSNLEGELISWNRRQSIDDDIDVIDGSHVSRKMMMTSLMVVTVVG